MIWESSADLFSCRFWEKIISNELTLSYPGGIVAKIVNVKIQLGWKKRKTGMSLTIAGIPDQLLSRITALAGDLFSDVKMETI